MIGKGVGYFRLFYSIIKIILSDIRIFLVNFKGLWDRFKELLFK